MSVMRRGRQGCMKWLHCLTRNKGLFRQSDSKAVAFEVAYGEFQGQLVEWQCTILGFSSMLNVRIRSHRLSQLGNLRERL